MEWGRGPATDIVERLNKEMVVVWDDRCVTSTQFSFYTVPSVTPPVLCTLGPSVSDTDIVFTLGFKQPSQGHASWRKTEKNSFVGGSGMRQRVFLWFGAGRSGGIMAIRVGDDCHLRR